jgi:hypothetical protein
MANKDQFNRWILSYPVTIYKIRLLNPVDIFSKAKWRTDIGIPSIRGVIEYWRRDLLASYSSNLAGSPYQKPMKFQCWAPISIYNIVP